MSRAIRVLIVDDSMFMRAAIKKTLTTHGNFEVVGMANDGQDGVSKAAELGPDVITMDYNMPRMDGAAAVREIMKATPTPVIMFSAHTKEGARETFEALAAGAIDFCAKPAGEVSADISEIAEDLVKKLEAAAKSRPRVMPPLKRYESAPANPASLPASARRMSQQLAARRPAAGLRVVIVGVSTGGPAALSRLVPALPSDIRFCMIVVQHMPPQFTAALAERLDGQSAVTVCEARDGDTLMPGLVYIAPGGRHLNIDARGTLRLVDGPALHGCKPAADVTMKAAAAAFGRRAVGVVMTGMGRDGADGLAAIKRAEGQTLAQNEDTSVIFGMPRAAIATGAVDEVLALDDIAGRLRYL